MFNSALRNYVSVILANTYSVTDTVLKQLQYLIRNGEAGIHHVLYMKIVSKGKGISINFFDTGLTCAMTEEKVSSNLAIAKC